MSRLVFLLEEYSMKIFLEGLLPRLFPQLDFLCIPHEGKQDLEKSVPRKIRAWREPGVKFIVLRDNDQGDCCALKERLTALCRTAGREDVLVRIACQELEAWYFGELDVLADAFGNDPVRGLKNKERFRDPDNIAGPSGVLKELVPEFQKISGARMIAPLLTREKNRSRSFHVLLEGIERMLRSSPTHRLPHD